MTASATFRKYTGLYLDNFPNQKKAMIAFAQECVTKALSQASKKSKMEVFPYNMEPWEVVPNVIKHTHLEEHKDGFEIQIDKESILSAYPIELIK